MSITSTDPGTLVLINSVERFIKSVYNASVLADPFKISVSLQTVGGSEAFSDSYPAPAARILKSAVGQYYVDIGNQPTNTETNGPADLMLVWTVELTSGAPLDSTLVPIKVISTRAASYMTQLKLMIDKSHKLIDTANDCYLGYNEMQLMTYLDAGLSYINAYQPYGSFTLDDFPTEYRQILVDSALVAGVMSQQLYAIDTDIPNYNDQGTSFVISHQPQLAAFLNQLTQRLDKLIPMMKLHMVSSGSVHVQLGPNFRLAQLLSASPTGAIFRNVFFKG